MDQTSLIQRILAGESRAYEELVKTYQHMVFTLCLRVLRNTEDAEEATQDAFVKAYQNLAGFDGRSKFSTWLYSIAYRNAISAGRRRRQESSSLDEIVHHPGAVPAFGNGNANAKHFVDRALARLHHEDASILSFYYLEEMTVDEIVTVTGLSASNVKVKLHRGRKKLAEQLEHDLGPEARGLLLEHA